MVKSAENGMKKGAWNEEEDNRLRAYIQRYGHWNWALLPRFAGVSRSGKSCRLRWMNYLRPNLKHGNFTEAEDNVIMDLHNKLGNKWSSIAAHLPGRTDNEIKNHWNTQLKKQAQNVPNYKDVGSLELNPLQLQKVENLSPTSTQLSSSGWQYTVSSDVLPQPSYEATTNFWTDPSFDNSYIITSSDHLLSTVDDYISQSYDEDMVMGNSFLWSTMDLCNEPFLF